MSCEHTRVEHAGHPHRYRCKLCGKILVASQLGLNPLAQKQQKEERIRLAWHHVNYSKKRAK